MINAQPRFRIKDKHTRNPIVVLQCSTCSKDIRDLRDSETIDLRRGYYCKDHDDGAIHLNMPEQK